MDRSPRATTSASARQHPLATPKAQRVLLENSGVPRERFSRVLRNHGHSSLVATEPEVLQVNIGRLCNMTCQHCHVDAGPDRVTENMSDSTVDACISALDRLPSIHTVDITGGAPELHPRFRDLVRAATQSGRHVIDRCNLTVLLLPRMVDLPQFLGEHGVEVVCSLPHYRSSNTDAQRGKGTYQQSMRALRRLNEHGYGRGDPNRILTLMSNPAGAYLPAQQPSIEARWKSVLKQEQDIVFDRLISLNNMPVSRFLEWLVDSQNLHPYMTRLASSFNPSAIEALMCRNTLSVGYDGRLFDCDFNQMLEMPAANTPRTIWDIVSLDEFNQGRVAVGDHCYGCMAGAGSSCGGQLN